MKKLISFLFFLVLIVLSMVNFDADAKTDSSASDGSPSLLFSLWTKSQAE